MRPTLEPPRPAAPPRPLDGLPYVPSGAREPAPRDEPAGPWQALRWAAVGFVVACAGTFVLPGAFVWFLCALPHEMGHATVGCLLGRPSAPAISLRGEAWTGIADPRPWLVWLVALACGAGAFAARAHRAAAVSLGALALAAPLLVLAGLAEIAIAAGGHLGELAFATYCFAIAASGGRTDTAQERLAGALAGGLLQLANIRLCLGLMTSEAAREHYRHSGSLGLKNDYLVLAEDLCRCRLETVAVLMLVLALLPLPLGLLLGAWRSRAAL